MKEFDGKSLQHIGESAFEGCSTLQYIKLDLNKLTEVGCDAFKSIANGQRKILIGNARSSNNPDGQEAKDEREKLIKKFTIIDFANGVVSNISEQVKNIIKEE